jgi:hypothetical protein
MPILNKKKKWAKLNNKSWYVKHNKHVVSKGLFPPRTQSPSLNTYMVLRQLYRSVKASLFHKAIVRILYLESYCNCTICITCVNNKPSNFQMDVTSTSPHMGLILFSSIAMFLIYWGLFRIYFKIDSSKRKLPTPVRSGQNIYWLLSPNMKC